MISILHRSERQFINVSEYSSVSHCAFVETGSISVSCLLLINYEKDISQSERLSEVGIYSGCFQSILLIPFDVISLRISYVFVL